MSESADRPATVRQMNELQLELLEKIFASTATATAQISEFREEVVQRLAKLETRDEVEDLHDARSTSKKSLGLYRTGILVSVGSVVANVFLTLHH